MRSNFLASAYTSRSVPLAGQTCVNLFFEPAPDGAAEMGMFYGSPGLKLHATVGDGPHRGAVTVNGVAYVVSGGSLYKIVSGVATLVGSVPGTGRVCLVRNETQLVVMHSAGWHVLTIASGAYAAVTDAPTTAQGCYQDSYIVYPLENGTYGWTTIGNASSLDALNFASAEGNPDPTIGTLSDHQELWLFGELTTEIYQTGSDPDAPFVRTAFIEHGCAAKYSPAKADNTVFWLGRDENGRGVVFRADGYAPRRVSNFGLETHIQEDGYTIEQAYGYCYQQAGHTFYVLTFPEATWAYDISTDRWTRLAYRNTTSGAMEAHRGASYCFVGGKHLVGDRENGNVYELDLSTYTDHGAPLVRERSWAVIESFNKRVRHNFFELIGEMGVGLDGGQIPGELKVRDDDGGVIYDSNGEPVLEDADVGIASAGADPVVLLDWSDEKQGPCKAWSNRYALGIGRVGDYGIRAIKRRLGMARKRVYRLRTSEPVKVAWYGVNLEAQAGSR